MSNYWVIVADGASARFMTLEHREGVPPRAEYHLVETARLSNPEHTVKGRRDTRKVKSGRDSGRGRLAPHGYTDHRDQHQAEVLRRFAAAIAAQAATLTGSGGSASLVLVADPRMLGLLRAELEAVRNSGVRLSELGHDYTWCSTPELYQHLVDNRLLPAPA